MNKITDLMSYSLAEAGIKDIKQLGFKKVQGEGTSQRITKRKGKYYTHVEKTIGYGGGPEPRLIDAEDIDDIKTDAQGITTATVKPYASYMLINKDTGEEVIQGKYAGQLTKYDKDQGFRWGNTTQTEGMTDFMIKFDDKGEALIYPRYEDTATDLTGLTMVAGVALAGTGFGAGLGGKLFAGGPAGFQASVGNALVNATISQATGGDFFKSFLTSALVPSVQAGLDNALGNSMFANMNVNPAFKRIASSTINSSITNGVAAAINGQDIGKAMYKGAILGGAGSATNQITSKIFTNDNLKFITDNTNLSYKQVMGAANLSVRKGVYNLTKGRNFFDGLTDSLVAHGVSSSVSNKVRSSLEATMKDNPAAIKMLTQTTGTLTNLYTKAAMSGRQVSPEMLQRILIEKAVAPSIVSQTSKAIKQVAKKGKEDLENLTES